MTPERKLEILEVIRNTSRMRGNGTFTYPKEVSEFLLLCENKETIEMSLDDWTYCFYIYRSRTRTQNCPIYINIHGGGFVGPHRENDDYYSAYMADKIHGIVIDVDYTLATEAPYPVALNQCMEILSFVRKHAKSWGSDEKNIAIGGYSAGGHLTAAMGIRLAEEGDYRPCLQIIAYAPLDYCIDDKYKMDAYDRVLPFERSRAFADLYFDDKREVFTDYHNSPLYAPENLLQIQPRTLMISAGKCNFRFEDEEYAALLADNGVEVKLKRFIASDHGFIPHFGKGWEEATKLMCQEILDAVGI